MKPRPDLGDGHYYNLGLTLVVPIEEVTKLMNSDKEKRRRERGVDATTRGATLSTIEDDATPVNTRDDFIRDLTKVTRHVEASVQESS